MKRRKLRWVLVSPEGDEVRSGLSFGPFDDDAALEQAERIASPPHGYTLRVFLDGRPLTPPVAHAAG